MNSLDCNTRTLVEAVFIGIICTVIGKVAFYFSSNKKFSAIFTFFLNHIYINFAYI